MRRRDFVVFFAGATAGAWPLVARGEPSKTPVIGFLRTTSGEDSAPLVAAFRRGLTDDRRDEVIE